MTNKELLEIALNGSPDFNQKAASVDTNLVPDVPTKAHKAMASGLRQAGSFVYSQDPGNYFVPVLVKSAEYVEKGIPAKHALYLMSDGNEKIAGMLNQIADGIAAEVLGNWVQESYQRNLNAVKK
jgi:hypothetical protein